MPAAERDTDRRLRLPRLDTYRYIGKLDSAVSRDVVTAEMQIRHRSTAASLWSFLWSRPSASFVCNLREREITRARIRPQSRLRQSFNAERDSRSRIIYRDKNISRSQHFCLKICPPIFMIARTSRKCQTFNLEARVSSVISSTGRARARALRCATTR